MDLLHQQVTALSAKVDSLTQMVEEMSHRLTEVLADPVPATCAHAQAEVESRGAGNNDSAGAMNHKHVLADENYWLATPQRDQKLLAPEVQIQRLTAQLTVAYHRIAALEEQLLAQRPQ